MKKQNQIYIFTVRLLVLVKMRCPNKCLFAYNLAFLLFINLLVLPFDLEDLIDLGSLDRLVGLEHMNHMLVLVNRGDL
jgi:hypothetical protein